MNALLARPQAEPSGPSAMASHRWRTGAGWLAFGVVLLLAVYVRCAGLRERGIAMEEPDTWKYLHVAQQWAEGHHTWMEGGRFYRPAIHLLHAWLWRAFGINHYIIKFANVGLDGCTILLIFLLTRLLSKSAWAGLAAVVLYAFVPNVIRNVWVEQHYSPSAFLILLSVTLAMLSLRLERFSVLRLPTLVLSGFAFGAAANMHPDLMLLAPGLVCGIAWVTVARKPPNVIDRLVANAAAFAGGSSGVYVLGVAFLGAKEVVTVASREFFEHTERYAEMGSSLGYFGLLSRIASESCAGLLQQKTLFLYAFLCAVLLAAGLPLIGKLRGRPREEATYGESGIVLLPVLSYAFLFALTIGWFKSWLLFYPLFPLAVIATVYWLHRLFSAFSKFWATPVTVAGAVLLACYNPHMTPGTLRTGFFAPDRLLPAYEFLRTRVDENNRVLVLPTGDPEAPFPAYQATAGLASPVYLDHLATYLPGIPDFPLPYTAEALRQICLKNRIRYILNLKTGPWEQFWTDETLRQFPQFQMVGSWQPYSYESEQEIVRAFLSAVGATKSSVMENGIFELPLVTSEAMNTKIDAPVSPFTPEVLRSKTVWDFRTLEPPSFAWLFPGLTRIKTPYGAISTVPCGKLAYIDLRGTHVSADAINGVWIEAMLDDKTTNVLEQYPLPSDTEVLFLWARQGDYRPGEWPYALVRRVALARVNAGEPLLFVATLKDRSPLWSGDITDVAIRFNVKSGPGGGRDTHLIVRRIGLF